jgi:hypothetical protein
MSMEMQELDKCFGERYTADPAQKAIWCSSSDAICGSFSRTIANLNR